jgi:hypothetical protein
MWDWNNLMDFDGDTTTIVEDGDCAVLTININLDPVHGRVSDLVVCRIDENFIKNLVETRNDLDIPSGEKHEHRWQNLYTIISFSESYTHIC